MVTLKAERAAEAYRYLDASQDTAVILKSLRYIKNSVIGNPTRKKYFLDQGISLRYNSINLSLFDSLKSCQSNSEIVTEVAPIIASLAQYDPIPLLNSGVLEPLFTCLQSSDSKVVESSARAIRALVQNPQQLATKIETDHIIALLKLATEPELTSKVAIQIADVSLMILCRLALIGRVRQLIPLCDGIPILIEWLNEKWTAYPKVQEAALDALASLCISNPALASEISHSRCNNSPNE